MQVEWLKRTSHHLPMQVSAQVIGDLVKARLGSIDEETALKLLKDANGTRSRLCATNSPSQAYRPG